MPWSVPADEGDGVSDCTTIAALAAQHQPATGCGTSVIRVEAIIDEAIEKQHAAIVATIVLAPLDRTRLDPSSYGAGR